MPRIRAVLWLAGLCVLGFSSAAARAADAERGRKLVYACIGCHGVENSKNAYPKYSVPKLGGQNEAYIVAALEQYSAGNRWHPTMRGYATTLTPEERADIAAYFASVGNEAAKRNPDASPPEKAQACVACHGQDGRGTTDEYPDIGGQHPDYLEQALNDYRLGKRKNPIMLPFAQQLSREDIAALAAYFADQPGLVTPRLD
jgi:cytochrome c553